MSRSGYLVLAVALLSGILGFADLGGALSSTFKVLSVVSVAAVVLSIALGRIPDAWRHV